MRRPPLRLLLRGWMPIVVVVLLANVAVLVFWTSPRWRAYRGAIGAVGRDATVREQLEPRLLAARETYGRVLRADAELRALREEMVMEGGGSDLLGMLVEAGESVGLRLDDATFQFAEIDELGVVQLGINLPVEGSYEAVRGLIDELAALPVFLVIDGIGLSAGTPDTFPAGFPPAARAAPALVRVELAISVFLDDPLGFDTATFGVAPAAALTAASRNGRSATATERLLRAAAADDPEELAAAMLDRLALLPPLPVEPAALSLTPDLRPAATADAPTRNLFGIVVPPPPPVDDSSEEAPALEVEPPVPVRLLGIVRVDGRWYASLGAADDLIIAAAGDRLPNGVEIVDVGSDFIEILFDNRRIRLTLEGPNP